MTTDFSNRLTNLQYVNSQKFTEDYLLPFEDSIIKHFLNDERLKASALRTCCMVKVLPKTINRKIHKGGWIKYAIIRLTGPSDKAIGSCIRSIEMFYPGFSLRKPYTRKPVVSLCVDESAPDNLNYSLGFQRGSHCDECFHEIFINSFYALQNRDTYPKSKPWKISSFEKKGIFNPIMSSIYNSKSYLSPEMIQFRKGVPKTFSGKLENSHMSNDIYSTNSYVKEGPSKSKSTDV